jgi:ubiquinone/menaquinone biosynthesis C-methylase UbiE
MPNLKNRIIWNVFAKVYDMAASRGIPYLQLVEKITGIAKDHCSGSTSEKKCIVDACCGTGNFSLALQQSILNAEVIGIDFSEAMLKRAKSKNNRTTFWNEDVLVGLKKIGAGSVDVLTMINGFYPLPDKETVLEEIYRVLRTDGILILSDPREGALLSKLVKWHISYGGWQGWIHLPFFIGGLAISALLQYKVAYVFLKPGTVADLLRIKSFKVNDQQAAYADQNYLFVASKVVRGDT